mgnify:CR=1 FL=1
MMSHFNEVGGELLPSLQQTTGCCKAGDEFIYSDRRRLRAVRS